MPYHRVESVVDQHLTQDMANYQLSRSLVSVGYYVNVETRSSIAHSHPYYELILVRRGVCEYLSGGARFLLHPDELLFISPGTVHTMICHEDSESYERLILQINADFMTQVLELYRLDGSKLPPLYICGPNPCAAGACGSWWSALMPPPRSRTRTFANSFIAARSAN